MNEMPVMEDQKVRTAQGEIVLEMMLDKEHLNQIINSNSKRKRCLVSFRKYCSNLSTKKEEIFRNRCVVSFTTTKIFSQSLSEITLKICSKIVL